MTSLEPNWLQALKTKYAQASEPHPRVSERRQHSTDLAASEAVVGTIYRASPMDPGSPSALVLVTQTDRRTQAVTVVLLSTDVELGARSDVLLSSDSTGLPYALMAQTDVFGYMWVVQLDRLLGVVDAEALAAIQAVRHGDRSSWPLAGPPVTEPGDVRWHFKRHELARLQDLTANCTRQLIDGDLYVSVDPLALRVPSGPEDALALEELVLCVYEATRLGQMSVPGWLIDWVLSDDLVTAYRAAGLFDTYRELMSVAQGWLRDAGSQPDPAPYPQIEGGAEALDAVQGEPQLRASREAYLRQLRQSGATSAWLMTRSTGASAPLRSHLHVLSGGTAMQVTFFTASSGIDRAGKAA